MGNPEVSAAPGARRRLELRRRLRLGLRLEPETRLRPEAGPATEAETGPGPGPEPGAEADAGPEMGLETGPGRGRTPVPAPVPIPRLRGGLRAAGAGAGSRPGSGVPVDADAGGGGALDASGMGVGGRHGGQGSGSTRCCMQRAPTRQRRWRWPALSGFGLLGFAVGAAVAVLLVLPLLALLGQAVVPGLFGTPLRLTPTLAVLAGLFGQPYTVQAAVDSAVLGAAVAVAATSLGAAVAYLLERTDLPGKRLFTGATWLVFLAPSFLLAQGWEMLLAPGGLWGAGPLSGALLSPLGVGAVLTLKLFPFAVFAVQSGLRGLGGDYERAARLAGANRWQTWRRVLLPLLLPALLAGATIVFAEVLGDFGVAATLAQSANFPLVTYAIYAALETFPANFAQAAASSLLLVAAVGLAQGVQSHLFGRRSFATRHQSATVPERHPLGRWRRWAGAGMAALFVLALGVPAASTFAASLLRQLAGGLSASNVSLANYGALPGLTYGAGALLRSLGLAAGAASLGVVVGLFTLLALRRRSGAGTFLQLVLTATIAIPGIVLGAGYIFFWNQPWLAHVGLLLYGQPAALLLAYVAGGLPYAVRVGGGALAQVPESLVQAARVAGGGLYATVRRIIGPLLLDTWGTIWLMLFATTVFELPASELLYPAGRPTVAVAIVHQMHNQAFGVGAALSVAATAVLGLTVGGLVLALQVARRALRAGRDAS